MSNVEYKDVLLKVEGVSLTLGGRFILRDVSFEVRDIVRPGAVTGQVVGLLGPSGIGKTQLFKVLAGLLVPSAGSVRITPQLLPVKAGDVGVLGQSYPLFEHRTVLGNLLVAGAQAGLSRSESTSKALSLLTRFGLADRCRAYPSQLSGGQRQRVAIAQQFMCSEHFLLMDEPFSGLDPIAVDAVCQLITEVASADTLNTIVIVTHDIRAAMQVCDQLWLLGGRDGAQLQAKYDLAQRGLAWRAGIASLPEFLALEAEIREHFVTL